MKHVTYFGFLQTTFILINMILTCVHVTFMLFGASMHGNAIKEIEGIVNSAPLIEVISTWRIISFDRALALTFCLINAVIIVLNILGIFAGLILVNNSRGLMLLYCICCFILSGLCLILTVVFAADSNLSRTKLTNVHRTAVLELYNGKPLLDLHHSHGGGHKNEKTHDEHDSHSAHHILEKRSTKSDKAYNSFTLLWDEFQSRVGCCGVRSHRDYHYLKNKLEPGDVVPHSCCKKLDCMKNPNRENSYIENPCEKVILNIGHGSHFSMVAAFIFSYVIYLLLFLFAIGLAHTVMIKKLIEEFDEADNSKHGHH